MNTLLILGFLAGTSPDADAAAALALAKAARERAPVVAKAESVRTGYPVRGNWWTHPGEIHSHLQSGEHRGKWPAEWVRSLTNAEAESLHSDDHEGRVKVSYVPVRSSPAVAPSPPPVAVPSAKTPALLLADPNCPTGH